MLVHLRVTPSITFAGTHLYTWVERGTVRVVTCPRTQRNIPGQGSNLNRSIQRRVHYPLYPTRDLQCSFYWITFINISHLNASLLRRTVSQWILFLFPGTAGDSLDHHRGSAFSTKDRDNDRYSGHCAVLYKGGWWYNSCQHSNLNGLYLKGSYSYSGVRWYFWKKDNESLKRSEMKIRPKDFWVLFSKPLSCSRLEIFSDEI